MKKLLITAITLAAALLCLFSCASDVTIYSKSEEIKPSVIIADFATSAETSAYNRVCSAVQDVLGRSGFYNKTDVYLEDSCEIIVGNSTNRTATAKALDLLNASYVDDGDTAAYAIYCYNGSIAIVASSDFALPIAVEYFIENYLTGETLTVNSNLVDLKTFSITAYNAALDAELSALSDANFAARWDEATSKMPPDAVDALKRLYNFYGTDWATWIYNLYDPDTGCFYYSNSARDYDGFFVDAESTCQALDILYHMGLFEELGNNWSKALPASMREKCLAYIQAMQDPEDGYFYHPQWGNEIGDARKGRDLSQCITLIRRMGGEPLYDTALDNIGDVGPVSSVISSFMDTDAHKSTVETVVDDRFKSEEGMKAYLDGLVNQHTNSKGIFDSYTFGHTLSSQTQQIVAAGLGEFVCDYIDGLQDPETGFYQKLDPDNPQAGYQVASGVIKIAAFYTSVNGAIKYGDKMLDTIFDIITDDAKTNQITYVFNPWGALGAAVSSIRNSIRTAIAAGEEPIYSETWLMQRIYTRLPALINATIEKLTPYKHADGSFSYKDDGNSLTNNQGVITSLGYNEGDVNGTACAMHYILNSLFGVIAIDPVPMLKYSDYMAFRDTVTSAGSVVKQEVPLPEFIDFEDYSGTDLPSRITTGSAATAEGNSVEVIDAIQRNGEEGKVLAITKQGTYFTTYIEAKSSHQKLACFTFSFDLYVDSADPDAIYQIFFTNTNQNNWCAYMLDISTSGGAVYIRDNVSNGSNKKNSPNDLEVTEKVDTWFNLKIEYYVLEEEETGKTIAKIKIYKNDVCVKISDNYFVNSIQSIAGYQEYLNDATGTVAKPAALSYINRVDLFTRVTPKSKIRIDNIDCIPSASAIFSDADVVPGAGLMVEPDQVVNNTIDFEDGVLDPELFVGNTEFFSLETKATATNANNKAYKLTSVNGQRNAKIGVQSGLIKKSVFTFEADICVDDVAVTPGEGAYQFLFNDVGTSAFMLAINISEAGEVSLSTWNNIGSSNPVVSLGTAGAVGSWFNLKLEYYPVSETEAHIVAYVNGIKTGESDGYYNKASGAAVVNKINTIVIYDRVATEASLYIDNIKFSYDAEKTYTPATPAE